MPDPSPRDAVFALTGPDDYPPAVVSLSDVHGHLDAARSALLTLSDHPEFAPIVEVDDDGRLHWAGGEEYVLVVNGDCVDRGPDSARVLALVDRLREEAPPGHVRHLLGNHEFFCLLPNETGYDRWFCDRVTDDRRRDLLESVVSGDLTVAYRGYTYTYSHAGQPSGVDPVAANDAAAEAAARALSLVGTDEEDVDAAFAVYDDYPVFDAGTALPEGGADVKGPGAGPLWLGFDHLPPDAPPQVVGHTRQDEPTRTGNVVCQDVVLRTRGRTGGEAVVVETPGALKTLVREADGSVGLRDL